MVSSFIFQLFFFLNNSFKTNKFPFKKLHYTSFDIDYFIIMQFQIFSNDFYDLFFNTNYMEMYALSSKHIWISSLCCWRLLVEF